MWSHFDNPTQNIHIGIDRKFTQTRHWELFVLQFHNYTRRFWSTKSVLQKFFGIFSAQGLGVAKAIAMAIAVAVATFSPCISPTMSRGRGWWQPLPVCDGSRCEKDSGFLILGWVLGWAQRAWTRLGPGVIGLGQTRCRSLLVLSSTEVTAVMEAAAALSSGTSSVLWQKGCSVIPGQFPVRQNS